jgi:hypothetical protein
VYLISLGFVPFFEYVFTERSYFLGWVSPLILSLNGFAGIFCVCRKDKDGNYILDQWKLRALLEDFFSKLLKVDRKPTHSHTYPEVVSLDEEQTWSVAYDSRAAQSHRKS